LNSAIDSALLVSSNKIWSIDYSFLSKNFAAKILMKYVSVTKNIGTMMETKSVKPIRQA
jgi:hypothetical protein